MAEAREKLIKLIDNMTHHTYSRLVVESMADFLFDNGVVLSADSRENESVNDYARYPVVGGIYRHFKGNLYRLTAVATDTETNQSMAVYESLEDSKVWCRPLEMFLSPVDREKYPDIRQENRFEFLYIEHND